MQNQEDKLKDEQPENETSQNESDIKAEKADEEKKEQENSSSDSKINELNDKYLRLYSEYDNYRKRTIREKADIIKTAAEDVLKAMLPVIDDFERAIKANENVKDVDAIKEGLRLIYNKMKNVTQQKGLQSFESKGAAFDPDTMEAITHIPVEDKDQKGKVVDEVEKGYKLGDKVIRYAKVVVGQ